MEKQFAVLINASGEDEEFVRTVINNSLLALGLQKYNTNDFTIVDVVQVPKFYSASIMVCRQTIE